MRRPRSLTPLLACAAALVGCGGPGETDPAALVPQGAPLYVGITVDPQGDQEAAVNSLVARFPGGEAGSAALVGALVQSSLEDAGVELDYDADVRPWVGERAGFYTPTADPDSEDGGVVIATTNADAAGSALERGLPGAEERSHEGVSYRYSAADDTAAAVVDDFVVVASEAAFRAVVDARDGASLVESDRYEDAVADLPDERLADVYVDVPAVARAAIEQQELEGVGEGATDQLAQLAAQQPLVASITATPESLLLDSAMTTPAAEEAAPGAPAAPTLSAEGSELLEDLPADAWLGLAQPDVGTALRSLAETLAAGSGFDLDTVSGLLAAQTGLDLQETLSWIGDVALFAEGTREGDLGGGAILETSDPGASERTLGALERLIRREGEGDLRTGPTRVSDAEGFAVSSRDLPFPVNFVQRGSRVAIAAGDEATAQALEAAESLGATAAFREATAALGEGYAPSLYASFEPVRELLDTYAEGDPDYDAARPYLEPFVTLVAGARRDGDRLLSRVRIGVE